ncbi:hypothetical protein Q3Y53_11985 [Synechococcus sp. YX-04-1]|nr:hypothetical protein [Synechococcus sp. YX-04-1]MDO6353261.1 hypothetical protein [Synechococcus sp. YX-04-1]
MTYKLIEMDGEHDNVILETNDLEQAKAKYTEVTTACKAGTYDFWCAFDELEDGLTIVLEDEDEEAVMEETFY